MDLWFGNCVGYPRFLPHSSLGHNPATNTKYPLDNTLYFRVSVKGDNYNLWKVCTDRAYIHSPISCVTLNQLLLK